MTKPPHSHSFSWGLIDAFIHCVVRLVLGGKLTCDEHIHTHAPPPLPSFPKSDMRLTHTHTHTPSPVPIHKHKQKQKGIDGGAVVEPLNDLVGILATLVDSRGMVLVPDFYADVEEVRDKGGGVTACVCGGCVEGGRGVLLGFSQSTRRCHVPFFFHSHAPKINDPHQNP